MPSSSPETCCGFLNYFLKKEYERMFFSRNIIRRIKTARVVAARTSAEHRWGYRRLILGKLINYGQNGFAFLRMLLISYLHYYGPLTDYVPYDPICVSMVLNFSFFAYPFTVASFSLAVNIFTCLVDYYITFCLDEQTLVLPYLVSVDSCCRRFLFSKACAPFASWPSLRRLFTSPVASASEWTAQMRSLWNGRLPLLPCGSAPCSPQITVLAREAQLPRLGAQTRTRTTLCSFVLEVVGFVVLTGIIILFIEDIFYWPNLILSIYTEQQLKHLTRLQRFILLVHVPYEVFISHYIFYRFLNNLVFLVQSLLLLVFIVRQHANDCNRLLEGAFLRRWTVAQSRATLRRGRRGFVRRAVIELPLPPPTATITITNLFFREHSRLVSTIDHIDSRFAARLVFASFFTNLPLNVQLIAQLMTRQSESPLQRLLLRASILNHWSCMLFFGISSSAIISYMGSSAPLLHRLQMRLLHNSMELGGTSRQLLFQRLKLAHYYQLVHSASHLKVGIHFGPVGLVTKRSFLDFLLFYTSLLMYTFKDKRLIN